MKLDWTSVRWMIRLFRVFVPVGTITLLISEILLVTSAFVLATCVVLEVDPTVFLFYDGGMMRILPTLLLTRGAQ